MAGPGGKSVGRVSIRVVPDTSRTKVDLQKSLARIEKSLKLTIRPDVNTTKAEVKLRRFQRGWDGEKIAFNVDTDRSDKQIERFFDRWNKKKLEVKVDAHTTAARAQVATLSRPRATEIFVNVNKASAVKAASILASLSGARVLGDLTKNVGEKIANLDRSLPRLAVLATSIVNLSSLALGSVGGLITVGASLASIAGAGLALPGILAGTGIGVATLAIALGDANERLAVLAPRFTKLRDLVRDNFWEQAREPILDLVRNTFPQLQAGLSSTSSALGRWAADVARNFEQAFSGGALLTMFDNLATSIDIARGGTDDFALTITRLGLVGSSYLPRLAQYTADLATRFDAFLAGAEADGRLTAWIERGIDGAQDLGRALAGIGGIFAGIDKAARAAGGSGLTALANSLTRISEIVNGPTFQVALTTLFGGAALGASGLADALGPIGDMIAALSPILASTMAQTGAVVGELLGTIADELAKPAFQEGFLAFFDGILLGLRALQPAIPAVVALLSTLGVVAGTLGTSLGQVLAQAIIGLAPVLSQLLVAVEPLIPVLGEALIDALVQLAPSMVALVTAITPLLPQLAQLAVDALPVVVFMLQLLIGAIGLLLSQTNLPAILPMLVSLMGGLAQFGSALLAGQTSLRVVAATINGEFGPTLQVLGQTVFSVMTAAMNVFYAFGAGVGGAMALVRAIVSGDTATIRSIISGFGSWLTSAWSGMWGGLAGMVSGALSGLAGAVRGPLNAAIALVNRGISALNGFSVTIPAPISALTGVSGTAGFNLRTIPSLAQGATIMPTEGGTLVRVAEAGRAESVVDTGLLNRQLALAVSLAERGMPGVTRDDARPVQIDVHEVSDPQGTALAVGRRFQALGV